MTRTFSTRADLPSSDIPIFTNIEEYREWRQKAFDEKKSVGFVPTMGALHDGHLSLVKHSLVANDLTVLSIFVNPAQFAPHEDLATYPRTLPRDLELLSGLSCSDPHSSTSLKTVVRRPSAVFLPGVKDMYPSGISQDVAKQKGTFVEVKGYGEQMEGKTRPTFFRGVATVVTKLFNIIQPTNAYFGQKDIQQALLLRRMVSDLHMNYPSPSRLRIITTTRDLTTGLALSSRNAYLSPKELAYAPALYTALRAASNAWDQGMCKGECIVRARGALQEYMERVAVEEGGLEGAGEGKVDVRVDYIEMNDPESFEPLLELDSPSSWTAGGRTKSVILSGAMWVGRTRLIDNLVLGDDGTIISA